MRLLALAALFAASTAMADTPRPTSILQPQTPASAPAEPLSVWTTGDAGALRHVESGLDCPRSLRGYQRTEVHIFDDVGLDVSCNYAAGGDHDITVYLTRRPSGSGVEDAVAEAKRELLQIQAPHNPTLIGETHSDAGGLAWTRVLYAEDPGLHTGIWIADLGGWTLEYRATYPAAADQAMFADIDAVTAAVQASAAPPLALCAKAPPVPARTGKLVTDKKVAEQAAMMTSLLGGAALAAVKDGKDVKPDPGGVISWCAQQALAPHPHAFVYWRAVRADGTDGNQDRLTAVTDKAPPTLVVALDGMAALVDAKAPHWTATIEDGQRTLIFGYFTDRPSPEALAALFESIVAGKTHPLGSYSLDGKNITITVPGH